MKHLDKDYFLDQIVVSLNRSNNMKKAFRNAYEYLVLNNKPHLTINLFGKLIDNTAFRSYVYQILDRFVRFDMLILVKGYEKSNIYKVKNPQLWHDVYKQLYQDDK